MTKQAFFDSVPWRDMYVSRIDGAIRHKKTMECPICCAFGGDNYHAATIGRQNGLAHSVVTLIIRAADNCGAPKYRAEMLRRINGDA